jgi:hypothetical protein
MVWKAQRSRVLLAGVGRVGRARLFDYLVGAQQHGLRNGEAEGLGHHAVDDEFVARGLLHWKIPGPSTLDYAIDEGAVRSAMAANRGP